MKKVLPSKIKNNSNSIGDFLRRQRSMEEFRKLEEDSGRLGKFLWKLSNKEGMER